MATPELFQAKGFTLSVGQTPAGEILEGRNGPGDDFVSWLFPLVGSATITFGRQTPKVLVAQPLQLVDLRASKSKVFKLEAGESGFEYFSFSSPDLYAATLLSQGTTVLEPSNQRRILVVFKGSLKANGASLTEETLAAAVVLGKRVEVEVPDGAICALFVKG